MLLNKISIPLSLHSIQQQHFKINLEKPADWLAAVVVGIVYKNRGMSCDAGNFWEKFVRLLCVRYDFIFYAYLYMRNQFFFTLTTIYIWNQKQQKNILKYFCMPSQASKWIPTKTCSCHGNNNSNNNRVININKHFLF